MNLPDYQTYHGNAGDFLNAMPPGAARLVITSPPYNMGKAYETRKTIDQYLADQELTIAGVARVLTEGGSVCWQVGNHVSGGAVYPLDILIAPVFWRHGFLLRNRIIWHYGHGLHASRRFSGRYETLLWFTKGEPYTFNLDPVRVPAKYPGKRYYKGPRRGEISGNPLGKNPADVWEIMAQEWETGLWSIPNVKSNHPEKTEHPCQFPIELAERCILSMSDPGDLIVDPYMGSGSSLLAALKNGRRAAGSDYDQSYLAIFEDRLTALKAGNLPYRPIGRPIAAPTGKVAQVPMEWGHTAAGGGRD